MAPDPKRLSWAEDRLSALEADLGRVRHGEPLGRLRPVAQTRRQQVAQLPRSSVCIVVGAVLIVAAIIVAAL